MLTKDELKTPRIFRPYGSIAFDATTATTASRLMSVDSTAPNENQSTRICNTSTSSAIRFEFGGSSTVTGTNSPYLNPGKTETFDRGVNQYIAIVAVTGTCSVSVTTGNGIYSGD